MNPLLLVLLLLFLAGCAQRRAPAITIEGVDVYAENDAKLPRGIGPTIRAINANVPLVRGARVVSMGSITVHPAPFDCGGRLVWGCSVPNATADARIVTSEWAYEGALIEELGHFMWQNVCGECENWTTTGGARMPTFDAWITETRSKAKLACAASPNEP